MRFFGRRFRMLAALLALLAAAAPASGQTPPHTPFSKVFSRLAGRLVGVVVNISTTEAQKSPPSDGKPTPQAPLDEFFRDFFGPEGAPGAPGQAAPHAASLGSGFIIDASGLIVTNNHVIANAEQILVTLSDNTSLQAKVVGRDPVSDLALLKVDPKKPLPAAAWGDSTKVTVGDWVLAIGNPFGLGGTVTSGIISATARDIHAGPYDDFLQTDASINRGNSGGPMFDLNGQVIGINTAIFTPSGGSIGIGFAIPAAFARPIIDQLKATGKVERGWIGARIQPMTDALAETVGLKNGQGAMIAAIDPESPAVAAKLAPGDVILDYDGKPVVQSRELPRLVAATRPGKTVRVTIWRSGKKETVMVAVAELNPNRPTPPPEQPAKPKPPPSVEALGLKLSRLTPDLAKHFSIPDGAKGLVVTEVPQNSPAAAQGLRPGDLVVSVSGRPVTSPDDVKRGASAAQKSGKKNLLVRVMRDGSARFFALPSG